MTEQGIEAVRLFGKFDYDALGNFVTPLINDIECAYCNFTEDDIAYCAIEKAFEEGKIHFPKPVSCHLYPVRISSYDDYEAVNYHKWHICKSALKHGRNEGVMLYQFLKPALIRKYGKEWYDKLDKAVQERLKEAE
jgi:hypothetical protein